MGYANALFKLGMTYGSKEAIEFTQHIFEMLMSSALIKSIDLAKEKGAFPKCKPEIMADSTIINNMKIFKLAAYKPFIEKIKKYGLRNCSLISIAPTGSIATMLGISGGCEPEFALSYIRKTDNLKESYEVYCQSVKEYWEMTDNAIDKGNIKSLPSYFVTSSDIAWKDRIDTQAIMQKYVDTAISSTVNLPKETTVEEIEKLYLYAWEKKLKGVTIFRNGCKRGGILVTDEDKADIEVSSPTDFPRGYIVDASDDLVGYKKKLNTGCGSIHFEVYADELTGEPQETFINIGSSGGCERNYQFISRLISQSLRAGVPIEAIIDQAMSIRPCTAYVNRTKTRGDTSPGTSCPSAIGCALKDINERYLVPSIIDYEEENLEELKEEPENNAMLCPECGEPLQFEGGCNICKTCGHSKCD